jgi:hypothetical protein
MLCDHTDEIAEEGFTCPFCQLMILGRGRRKMLERPRHAWVWSQQLVCLLHLTAPWWFPSKERGMRYRIKELIRQEKKSSLEGGALMGVYGCDRLRPCGPVWVNRVISGASFDFRFTPNRDPIIACAGRR